VGISPRHQGERIDLRGLVCTDAVGRPLQNAAVASIHQRIAHAAGLPVIRVHDLRHICATLPLGANVSPKIVSNMLGHTTVQMTLNIYSYVQPYCR
jgi:integrase